MLSQIPPLSPYLDTPLHPGNARSHASMHRQLFKHRHTALPNGPALLTNYGVWKTVFPKMCSSVMYLSPNHRYDESLCFFMFNFKMLCWDNVMLMFWLGFSTKNTWLGMGEDLFCCQKHGVKLFRLLVKNTRFSCWRVVKNVQWAGAYKCWNAMSHLAVMPQPYPPLLGKKVHS